MARVGLRLFVDAQMLLLFGFSIIAGACISDTIERHRNDAIMASIMQLSLRELGEIKVALGAV